jgi:hypothetical protein
MMEGMEAEAEGAPMEAMAEKEPSEKMSEKKETMGMEMEEEMQPEEEAAVVAPVPVDDEGMDEESVDEVR